MENEKISYFAHEGMMARMERVNHRQWVVIIILIVALVTSNLAWVLYESQFETYTETTQKVSQSAESDGGDARALFVGGDYNGENDTNNDNNNP